MKKLLHVVLLASVFATATAIAQEAKTDVIAIFPFKNLYNEVQYNDLGWSYADSLEIWLNAQPGAGTEYEIIPNIDVRDQMLAGNVDVTSPSYETDVWTIAEALGADKLLWGVYYVKYGKVYLETKIIDLSINMADPVNMGESKGLRYEEATGSVPSVGEKILPGL